MSAALAAARKRRGTTEQVPPPPAYGQNVQQQPQGQLYGQPNVKSQSSAGLTLPQVIALIDKRLIALEENVKQSDKTETTHVDDNKVSAELNAIVEEFNTRYSILAQEIDSLKDMLLKLQSFTMEVNKTLMDERIRVFSDIETINTNLDMKRPMNFDKLENIQGFSQRMDYLEQTGEFDIASEIANNQEKLTM
jgi:septation ring formation regulator EzrA